MTESTPEQLIAAALRWISDDPDPAARAELRQLVDGMPATADQLAERFVSPLRFGTAGLRGPLRAGPNGMNQAVVGRTTAGLLDWMAARGATGPVVIGYDARHGSQSFAERVASVVTGAGRPAILFPRPLPTPVLAAAVRLVDAAAGVMVTASHNPPQDNGYKVYLGRHLCPDAGAGAQLVSPADAEIEAAIAAVREVHCGPLPTPSGEDLVEAYLTTAATVATTAAHLRVAYTPLHGVGRATFAAAMARAGFDPPVVVPEQAQPDPDFPTVAFPNPEEPGATDLLLALATATDADIAIAHDPDADRCAVGVPDRAGWRMLTGDELGILLADHLIRRGARGGFATTIVSSTLLSRLCAARGLRCHETLTGFKWIMRSEEDLSFGYEEALGYSVLPSLARDKDGITAGLLVCELAAQLAEEGRRLTDRLDDLALEFGLHATGQLALRFDTPGRIAEVMATIRARPPRTLLTQPVTEVRDLSPDADVLSIHTDTARVVVRPSGTEPKLKAYLEIVDPVTDGDVVKARRRASAALSALRAQTAQALGLDVS